MNKKILTTIFIIFLGFTGIFFAFKPKLQNNEVVFWTLQMSDFAPYMNEVISNFEKENPQIKIKWVDVPFSEGEKRTLASVLSDNPPDLVNLNPDFSSTLANKGALWEIDEENTKQFNQEIINSTKTNGKIYSIPWYATSAVTIYNKKLLSSVPKTYEQMADLAPAIRSKNAYITLPNITENDTMLKILNKYPQRQKQYVFTLFKDLIPKETVTMTLQEALEKYMSGNIALISAGANFLNMIKENAPQIYNQTDVAPQLTGSIGQNDFSLMNFVIPLRAKHKEDALKFALFLTNEENQLKLAKQTNILAVNKKALNNEFYTKYDENDLMSKARVISAKQLNKLQPTFKTQKNQKEINNLVNAATQSILLNKDTTENILNNLNKELKAIGE